MSAFGKKNGLGGGKSSFGVAKPMNGGGKKTAKSDNPEDNLGGNQFPPIESIPLPGEGAPAPAAPTDPNDAMARLSERSQPLADGGDKEEGFGASVHKIKEQVLPRLLERVDPEAA